MWYQVKDSKTTMHKSECHPNTVRINVGIIYIDNYNGQEGVFVSGAPIKMAKCLIVWNFLSLNQR